MPRISWNEIQDRAFGFLIFEKKRFDRFLRDRTRDDGSDFGPMVGQLFEVPSVPQHGHVGI